VAQIDTDPEVKVLLRCKLESATLRFEERAAGIRLPMGMAPHMPPQGIPGGMPAPPVGRGRIPFRRTTN
jgi:hypothetical protein